MIPGIYRFTHDLCLLEKPKYNKAICDRWLICLTHSQEKTDPATFFVSFKKVNVNFVLQFIIRGGTIFIDG